LEVLRDDYGRAQVLNTLGNVYRRGEHWQESESYYQRSIAITSQPATKAVAHLGLSYVFECYYLDLNSAVREMQEAIKYQERTGRADLVRTHRQRLKELQGKVRQ
jgi:ribosomal protein L30/L7E